jgi:hypothetical protein
MHQMMMRLLHIYKMAGGSEGSGDLVSQRGRTGDTRAMEVTRLASKLKFYVAVFLLLLASATQLLLLASATRKSLPDFDALNARQRVSFPEKVEAAPHVHMLVIADGHFRHRYAPIFQKMSEYAQRHGYTWTILSTNSFDGECKQYANMFFLKHCWVAAWMEQQNMPDTDTIFVFDSDVVPYRTNVPLDHWASLAEDVVFYTRTWSTEIAAGNYAVRNTVSGREFLRTWAGYEYQMPPGFSSADNGALHVHLLRFLNLESKHSPNGICGERYRGLDITVTTTNLARYWEYVECTRELLPECTRLERGNFSTRILAKDTGFVMDGYFDTYGRDGHGQAGVGPVFHHGIKIHKAGVLSNETAAKYNLTMTQNVTKQDDPDSDPDSGEVPKKDDPESWKVTCGNHMAASCGECSQGQGANWCNGDCHWCEFGQKANNTRYPLAESDRCIVKSDICHQNK